MQSRYYLPYQLDPNFWNALNSFNSPAAKAKEISQLIRYLDFLSLFCERCNPLWAFLIFTQNKMPCKIQYTHQNLDPWYCWIRSRWASSFRI